MSPGSYCAIYIFFSPEILDLSLSKFLSVKCKILLSDPARDVERGKDYKKKHKLLQRFAAAAKNYSK